MVFSRLMRSIATKNLQLMVSRISNFCGKVSVKPSCVCLYVEKPTKKNHNKSEIFFFLFGWGKLNRRKIEILIEEKLVTLKFTFVFDWKTLITRILKILEVKINFFFEISPLFVQQALNFQVILRILQ